MRFAALCAAGQLRRGLEKQRCPLANTACSSTGVSVPGTKGTSLSPRSSENPWRWRCLEMACPLPWSPQRSSLSWPSSLPYKSQLLL